MNHLDPVTHVKCFRLQDQQKTIIIVGQSPSKQSTNRYIYISAIFDNSSDNTAKISVFQTLANGDRSLLETWGAPTTKQQKSKGSALLTIRTILRMYSAK
jgi:hypothetical protein